MGRVPRRRRLKQSTLRETEDVTRPDDYMVNNFRIDQLQATHQPFRDHFVRVARVVHRRRVLGFIRECQHGLFIRC
jgi:hypothetical protein